MDNDVIVIRNTRSGQVGREEENTEKLVQVLRKRDEVSREEQLMEMMNRDRL
jgi:hypothetical protein